MGIVEKGSNSILSPFSDPFSTTITLAIKSEAIVRSGHKHRGQNTKLTYPGGSHGGYDMHMVHANAAMPMPSNANARQCESMICLISHVSNLLVIVCRQPLYIPPPELNTNVSFSQHDKGSKWSIIPQQIRPRRVLWPWYGRPSCQERIHGTCIQ